MELKWVEDFLAVARLRNFSQAALARHATQSALSRRIRALESWYGVQLFDRSTYPVVLTAAGGHFLPLAEEMVANLYRSRREARAEFGAAGRKAAFAMPHSLAVSFFPGWWQHQPWLAGAAVSVLAADFAVCVEMLLGGACDYLLCYGREAAPAELEAHHIHPEQVGRDRLVLVSATDADGRPCHAVEDGARQPLPLLTYPQDSFLGRMASGLHARLETYAPTVVRYESALVEALRAEVLQGKGLAWLPESMVAEEVKAGRAAITADPNLGTDLTIWLCRPVKG